MVSLLKSKKIGDFHIVNDTNEENNEDQDLNQKMFIVVRNTKSTDNNHDYQLCVGDIIKLGRIKFKVRDFFGSGLPQCDSERTEIDIQHSARSGCKICWGQEHDDENPLLNSCQCDGSVRYIHFKCLK
jgi:hypothetical protein